MANETELPNLGLLIKCLKMTTATNDGEALSAIRMANAQLAKFGGDWETLLRSRITIIGADPFANIPAPATAPKPEPKPEPKTYYHAKPAAVKPAPAWQPPPRPAPPPPKPQFPPAGCTDSPMIAQWFDVLEFVLTLPGVVQAQVNDLSAKFKRDKYLQNHELSWLETVGKPYIRRTRGARR